MVVAVYATEKPRLGEDHHYTKVPFGPMGEFHLFIRIEARPEADVLKALDNAIPRRGEHLLNTSTVER